MNTASQMIAHVLVIDDDERLRELIRQYLEDQGFLTSSAANAREARARMAVIAPDALVLDLMMPGETGLEFAASLDKGHPPILMLTAMGEAQDRITGLEAGASDYLVKPFEPRELVLRLRNILRRRDAVRAEESTVRFGEFEFELASMRLARGAEQIYLTTSEATCLKALAEHAGQPLSREQLAELTSGLQEKSNERSVDVQINRLRKKIEAVPGRPVYIQTVRGAGYVLHADRGGA